MRARTWVGYAGPDVAPVTTDWPPNRVQIALPVHDAME